jgi:hypothetical protein
MPHFQAIYAYNRCVAISETTPETVEKVEAHGNGRLIYAIIDAPTIKDAEALAIALAQDKRKTLKSGAGA